MSGPGGIGGNRPTNNIASYPSTSPNSRLDVNDPELNEHGRFVAEQQAQAKTVALAGGPQRTAQAQPPGKSFTETMGAAFTAMGAAVTSFFKGLGDRIATIEMPSLPRISLRRQEAAQANAYNPDDMSPKQRGQAQKAVKAAETSQAVLAQLTMTKEDGSVKTAKQMSSTEKLVVILNSDPDSTLSKEFDKQVKKEVSSENLDYMRDMHSGIHLDADYVAWMKSDVNTNSAGLNAIGSAMAALNASGIESLDIRMDTNSLTKSGGNSPIRFEMSGLSSEGELGALGLEVNGLNEAQTAALKSLGDALSKFTKGVVENFIDTIPRFVNGHVNTSRVDPNVIRADQEGQVSMARAAENDQAEIGKLNAMSTPDFAQALQADPSLARRLPEMALGSEARQAFMTYAVAQPPGTTLQDKVAGFAYQVRDQIIQESLAAGGMTDAPVQAPAALPSVHLDSLAHLLPLSAEAVQQGKSMEGLREFMVTEFSQENMDCMATGAALLRFENALGHEVPPNFNLAIRNGDVASLSLNFDLPVVRQWAEQFVGDDALTPANLPSGNATNLKNALNSMPVDAASATDNQRSALTTAMANCLEDIQKLVIRDTKPRYESAQTR